MSYYTLGENEESEYISFIFWAKSFFKKIEYIHD